MDLFGLGILLEFRDRATPQLMNASRLFQQLRQNAQDLDSAMNSAMEQINASASACSSYIYSGKQIISVGTGMANVFKNMASSVISTGDKFEKTRVTLKALYKDADVAKEKLNQAMQLAATTPFEVEDVTSALVGFKALGVEALDMFEGTNGEMRTFLEYMGDLGALRPDVGLEGVMLGVRNLLGGDGGLSLRARMDIDFENILGRDFGDTPEEIMKDLVEASQKVANGLMTELEGTWSQLTSNLGDQVTKMLLNIADGGAFDSAKKSLMAISDVINAISDEELTAIGQNLASAFNVIWKPVDLLARGVAKLITVVKDLAINCPEVLTLIATLGLVATATTIAVGGMAVMGGMIGLVKVGLSQFSLSLVSLASKLGMTNVATRSFGYTVGFLSMKLLAFSAVIGGLYLAWKSDFGGIRTLVTDTMSKVKGSFSEASRIMGLDTEDMLTSIRALKESNDVFDKLTLGIIQVAKFFSVLADAWDDFTISEDSFLIAKELGILPLIESILDLKMISTELWNGFKEGFKIVSDVVGGVVSKVAEWVGIGIGKVLEFLTSLGFVKEEGDKTKQAFNEGIDLSKWFDVGKVAGIVSGILVVGGIAVKVVGIISGVFGIISGVFGTIVGVVGTVVSVISSIAGPIGLALTTLSGILGLPVAAIVAIGVALAVLVGLVIAYWDEIWGATKSFLSSMGEGFTSFWNTVLEPLLHFVSDVLVSGFSVAMGVIGGIIDGFVTTAIGIVTSLVQGVITILGGVIDFIVGVFTGNWSQAWQGVVNIFKGIFDSLVGIAKAPLNGIISMVNGVINGINSIHFSTPDWDWLPDSVQGKEFGISIPNIPMLNTGGYIKSEGMAMLHPNEIVVNSELTNGLREFLKSQKDADKEDSPVSMASVVNRNYNLEAMAIIPTPVVDVTNQNRNVNTVTPNFSPNLVVPTPTVNNSFTPNLVNNISPLVNVPTPTVNPNINVASSPLVNVASPEVSPLVQVNPNINPLIDVASNPVVNVAKDTPKVSPVINVAKDNINPVINVAKDSPVLPTPIVNVARESANIPTPIVNVQKDNQVLPTPVINVQNDNNSVLPTPIVNMNMVKENNAMPSPIVNVAKDNPVIPTPIVNVAKDQVVTSPVVNVAKDNVVTTPVVNVAKDNVVATPNVNVSNNNVIPTPIVNVAKDNVVANPLVTVQKDNLVVPSPVVNVQKDSPVLSPVINNVTDGQQVLPTPIVNVAKENAVVPSPKVVVQTPPISLPNVVADTNLDLTKAVPMSNSVVTNNYNNSSEVVQPVIPDTTPKKVEKKEVMTKVSNQYYNTSEGSTLDKSDKSTSIDNKVVFEKDSIQINVQSATSQDAEKLATMIMDKIAKKQRIRSTLHYKPI